MFYEVLSTAEWWKIDCVWSIKWDVRQTYFGLFSDTVLEILPKGEYKHELLKLHRTVLAGLPNRYLQNANYQ
jgi:hypothetical protein